MGSFKKVKDAGETGSVDKGARHHARRPEFHLWNSIVHVDSLLSSAYVPWHARIHTHTHTHTVFKRHRQGELFDISEADHLWGSWGRPISVFLRAEC